LAASTGHSKAAIADRLGITVDDVDRLVAEGAENARRHLIANWMPERLPRPAWIEEQRGANATRLVDDRTFVRVEVFEDDDDDEMPDGWDWSPYAITFSDLAAHGFDELVADTVAVARAFPGVADALRGDREVILLKGEFDPEQLEAHLRQWWTSRLIVVAER
jgi:hypothetical protein